MGDDHSIETVTQLARQGFYGDLENNHSPVDADLCQRLINHVHKWCNVFITHDDELDGSMENLVECFVPSDDIFDDMEDEEEAQQIDVQVATCGVEDQSDSEE